MVIFSKRVNPAVLIGVLLILAGLLSLLSNFNILRFEQSWVWALLFAIAGLMFLGLFIGDRTLWWALIPAFVLLGLAGTTLLSSLPFRESGEWAGGFFLGMMGLGFGAIYLVRREQWWAIIPGGALITLGIMTVLTPLVSNAASAGILFLGMAVTFGLVYFAPTPHGRMTWAIFPAIVLLLMSLAIGVFSTQYANLIWPAALVIAGIFLLVRAFVR